MKTKAVSLLLCLHALLLAAAATNQSGGQTGVPKESAGAVGQVGADPNVAYSATYNQPSKKCRDDDALVSEGDEFGQLCRGFGEYSLVLTGFGYKTNFGVRDKGGSYMEYLRAVEGGPAEKFDTGEYDTRLGEQIKWMLDGGRPFAFSVRVSYYKDRGTAQKTFDPKNKVAEFVFVRGLKGSESLKHDLDVRNTAYNPDEQDRRLAFDFLERRAK